MLHMRSILSTEYISKLMIYINATTNRCVYILYMSLDSLDNYKMIYKCVQKTNALLLHDCQEKI